jgi:hypothetical protein
MCAQAFSKSVICASMVFAPVYTLQAQVNLIFGLGKSIWQRCKKEENFAFVLVATKFASKHHPPYSANFEQI